MTKNYFFGIVSFLVLSSHVFSQTSQTPGNTDPHANAETSKPTPDLAAAAANRASIAETIIERELKAEPVTDSYALDQYKSAIGSLLKEEQFDRLEGIAAEARANKTRFSGGVWKLFVFYQGLTLPYSTPATPANWPEHLARLERWKSLKPESITARVALAQAYASWGSQARGNGYADSVTEEGWKLFGERVATAKSILEDAASLKTQCPHWYYAMLTVAKDQGADRAKEAAIFNKAITFEPLYYYYYRLQAGYLLPKWYGDDGEMERFADEISNQLNGADGKIVYFEIASEMARQCNCDTQLKRMSWKKIQQGHTAMEEKYGPSINKLNQFARMAVAMSDGAVAQKAFDQIGDNWDWDVWRSRERFTQARDWASHATTTPTAGVVLGRAGPTDTR